MRENQETPFLPRICLLEKTDGLLRPPLEGLKGGGGGGDAEGTQQRPLGCGSLLLLRCALLMTSSHSKVLLSDVLMYSGLLTPQRAEEIGVKHVQFKGVDGVQASIPIEKVSIW